MPLARTRPMRFRPRSLSDTLDGTNTPEGACSALVNLIQDPSTTSCLQCRPAAIDLSLFETFTTPGVVSVGLEINNLVYGLIASGRNSGKDEPFCYDLISQSFKTVDGIAAGNTPDTQLTMGDWTPATMAAQGTRVLVTHPGFSGTGNDFGYFDASNVSEVITGNIASGSNKITGSFETAAFGPGYKISGTGIPTNTTLLNSVDVTPQTTGTTTVGSNSITSVVSITDFAVGQPIAGVGIPTGATITAVAAGTITISANATAAGAVTISASGSVLTMSANATATTTGLSITVAGGTSASPLWAAGTTTNIPLSGVATNVAQFNNRAYFSIGKFLTFTDPLTLNVSQATQALSIGDVSPITCLEPLTIINAATAAPVQGLLTFKEKLIVLVTGDPTTNDLAVNTISPSGVGTTSPSAVTATPVGVFFPDVDGLRVVELTGNVSDPLPDVREPFINALNRTRMSGAYNAGIYRCCLQNGTAVGSPFQEYWFDLKYKLWTGPHTFQQSVITAWKGTFVSFSNARPAVMQRTDVVQTVGSTFIENGILLNWQYGTSALPNENANMQNSMVVSTINMAFKSGAAQIQCIATDENGTVAGQATIYPPGNASVWGTMIWGVDPWYGQQFGLMPHQIPWTKPVVFSKLILSLSAASSLGFQISNFQADYQQLGYVSTSINS